MRAEVSRSKRRQRPAVVARNDAIAVLRRLGLSPRELAELVLEDLDREGRRLRLGGEPPEWLPLPENILPSLIKWCAYRGDRPGALFTSMRKEDGEGFTPAGMRLILPRVLGEQASMVAGGRRSVAERRTLRNQAILQLFAGGVTPRALASMSIEDLRHNGVAVGGSCIQLPERTLIEVRRWREQLNRSVGPLFVNLRGGAGQAMTESGIRLILKSHRARSPRSLFGLDPSFWALLRLWLRLPVELRRRSPRGKEVAEVAQWVREACEGGAVLEEVLRIVGLSSVQFTLACLDAEVSEALNALEGGEPGSVSRYNQSFRHYHLPQMGIDPNG